MIKASYKRRDLKSVTSVKLCTKKNFAQCELNKTCRLCLKPGNRKIFEEKSDFDIALNIRLVLGIQVEQNDAKPQNICNSCEEIIKSAVQLKLIAEITQWRLQQELDFIQDTKLRQYSPEQDDYEGEKHNGEFLPDVVQSWSCRKCRKVFNSKLELTEHKKVTCQRSLDVHVCESCGLRLKKLAHLKRHRLIHTGELSHQCSVCPYRARTKYALTSHQRTHTGSRPFCCPQCPATFHDSSNLASHRRKHLPPQYHCEKCQKGFKFRAGLQNHMATQHSNNKSHTCTFCSKAYATRKMMRRHEIEVHNRPKMRKGRTPTYVKQQDFHT